MKDVFVDLSHDTKLPETFDWNVKEPKCIKGVPVKNQASCGSC